MTGVTVKRAIDIFIALPLVLLTAPLVALLAARRPP